MPTCPNGHQSGSDDWCEVCGHRMAGAVPPPPPPPPAGGYGFPPPGPAGGRPGAEPELCPQCRTPREGGAPFCEECRWNFLTNTATSYTPAAPRPATPSPTSQGPGARFQPPGQGYGTTDSFDYQGSRPSQINRPAEPIPAFGDPGGPGGPGGQGGQGGAGYGNPGQGPGGPGYGGPSRPGPQQPGPAQTAGAPQAFQQPGTQAPQGFPQTGTQAPAGFPQETRRPPRQGGPGQQGGQPFGGGNDDWVISPPSSQGQGGPGGPGAGQGGGAYGYPQAGPQQTQQQPVPGYPQQQQQAGPATWLATIGPDRDYFMAMMQRSGPEAAGLNLPAYSPEQQRTLTGNQITIGRRRHSTGDTPDIDLSVPPEDPGVSHQHAVLVQQPDGSWAVVDQNSTNGTTVNGGEEPIQPFVPVPLQDGDRVHVGAWTTITVRRG